MDKKTDSYRDPGFSKSINKFKDELHEAGRDLCALIYYDCKEKCWGISVHPTIEQVGMTKEVIGLIRKILDAYEEEENEKVNSAIKPNELVN